MIFQYTWEKVLTGEKTQTRRIVKPDHNYAGALPHAIPYVYRGQGHSATKVYEVGKTYAVQPGRGKPTIYTRWSDMTGTGYEVLRQDYSPELANWGWKPLRIRILNIHIEDVRNISMEDAKAEGFSNQIEYIQWWVQKYHSSTIRIEPYFYRDMCVVLRPHKPQACLKIAELRKFLGSPKRYIAWVLEFERV